MPDAGVIVPARRSLLILLLAVPALLAAQPRVPEAVQANIRERVDAGWAPSIVVGMVDSGGTSYFAYGRTAVDGGVPVSEHTVYEIGSITKAFTGVLLAELALSGRVGLDDPVRRHLPASVRMPGDDAITLRLLSAHRSGLPRLPANLAPRDSANPYADYDAARLYAFLTGHALRRAPDAAYEYSNLGTGLLGHALALASGQSLEELFRRHLLAPLGMRSTMITLSADARARLAFGSAEGRAAANWDADVLAGAGMLRSTAQDMTRFLAAAIGLTRTTLDSAFRLAAEPRFAAQGANRIGLGWHILTRGDTRVVWHNGGTGGYRSWAGYDPVRRLGVVVLTNATETIDDVGLHLLAEAPLAPVRRAIALPADALEEYVGTYRLAPTFAITVARQGGHLTAQATGQPAFRIWPSSRDTFFLKVVNAELRFTRNAAGRVDGTVLFQNGAQTRGERQPER